MRRLSCGNHTGDRPHPEPKQAMQALRISQKMRYVTPLVFNYSFAVNNYRSPADVA